MHITRLPYQANGAAVFSHFAHQPYAVFFDSCGIDRFDIIAANPGHVIITHDRQDDPFALAKAQLNSNPQESHPEIPDELPFTVGAIGYLSYDLGYGLVHLTSTAHNDIDLPQAVIGFYEWSIVIDHRQHISYLISREPPDHPALLAIKELISQPCSRTGHFSLTGNFLPNMNKIQYAAAFEKVKQHIHAGDCYQINLAQRFTSGLSRLTVGRLSAFAFTKSNADGRLYEYAGRRHSLSFAGTILAGK